MKRKYIRTIEKIAFSYAKYVAKEVSTCPQKQGKLCMFE
jgi:hypothetical protein